MFSPEPPQARHDYGVHLGRLRVSSWTVVPRKRDLTVG